jgi:2-polyprenyl-3-methyl-5-hydroxy-6-metoxy-1,4-benzoquinol methylase
MNTNIQLIEDPEWDYKRLDPIPTSEELAKFYETKYYNLVAQGGRAPGIGRLMKEDAKAKAELDWLEKTLWADIAYVLAANGLEESSSLLDIGCGLGHFCHYFSKNGWTTTGIEPSNDAREVVKSFGIPVYKSLEEYEQLAQSKTDAITMLNVLEHLRNPVDILKQVRSFMHDSSILVIRVPNEFNPLQTSVVQNLNKEPWWIAVPEHINYFNFDSLKVLLEKLGFEVIDMMSDFPMELFLLFGDDYIGNADTGRQCHAKRVSLELTLTPEVRRRIYRSFATSGIGRQCLFFAKLGTGQ